MSQHPSATNISNADNDLEACRRKVFPVIVCLPPSLQAEVDAYTSRIGSNRSEVVRRALREYMERQEGAR